MSDEKEYKLQDILSEYSDGVPEPPPPTVLKRPAGAELFEWLQMVLICVVGAVIAFNCVVRLSVVNGHSMDPTLEHGELMLVWSLGYEPSHGDVVVLNKTTAHFLGEAAIVKRVIALEGQSVDIDYGTGTVYVDGEALEEDYTLEEMYQKGGHMSGTHFEVPEGEIFVMGDNRNGSTDSRDDRLGTIHEDYVLGKAVCAIWPIGKIGVIR